MVTRHHLKAWARLPKVEVVAIYNRHLDKADLRAKEFGIPKTYSDIEKMLDEEKPDALDIAVAVEAHAQCCRLAADRGIAILCQKPMTPTYPEAATLVQEIGERVPFMVHENWRFRPQYRQAARWIREGKTGPLQEFRFSSRSSGLIVRNERGVPFALERQPFFAQMPRLIIFELLIHHLDTIRSLAGEMEIISVTTSRISPDIIGEDLAQILLKSERGAMGMVSGNLSAPGFPLLPQDRLELIGQRGSILFDGEELSLRGESHETHRFTYEEFYQGSYDQAIAHFVESLLAGVPFETDRLDNLKTLKLVEDACRLARFETIENPDE